MMPHSSALMVVDYQNGKGPVKEEASTDAQSPFALLLRTSKKLQDDLESLGLEIKQHEDNLVLLNTEKIKLDYSILDRQGKCHSSTRGDGEGFSGSQNGEGTVQQILHHDKSAASLLCQLETYHVIPPSIITLTKDVVGVVANLGKAADANLSSLLSEYLGVDTMLAVVCKNFEGVKALERFDEQGQIDKSSGLHGLGAAVGKHLHGRFHTICLEDLRSYVGEFVPNDPQRRLHLLKPRMRNGEIPPGFLDFAVNMINLDPSQLNYLTTDGQGLRETLFYSLFHRTQVYKTRAEMLNALPFIADGAISLDGGMIRSPGVYLLGDREDVLVQFSVVSEGSSLTPNYIETEKEMKKLKWKKEKLMEEMQREQVMVDQAKKNFESKKQEFVRFLQQTQSYESQDQLPQSHDAGPSASKRKHRRKGADVPREKKKAKQWSVEESLALARAWIEASEDLINSNYQRAEVFTDTLIRNFHKLMNKPLGYRGEDSISSKWRTMKLECQKFNQIYIRKQNANNHPSGTNNRDLLVSALDEYKWLTAKSTSFQYLKEWELLRKCSKFLQLCDDSAPTRRRGQPRPKKSKTTSTSADPASPSSDASIHHDLNASEDEDEDEDEAEPEPERTYSRPPDRDKAKKAANSRSGGSSSHRGYVEEFRQLADNVQGMTVEFKQTAEWGVERDKALRQYNKLKEREQDIQVLTGNYNRLSPDERATMELVKQQILQKYKPSD